MHEKAQSRNTPARGPRSATRLNAILSDPVELAFSRSPLKQIWCTVHVRPRAVRKPLVAIDFEGISTAFTVKKHISGSDRIIA